MNRSRAGKPPIFYGWYIVFTCMFIALITNGVRNSFAIFIIPLEMEFDWSRGTISIAASVGFFANAVTQPFMGRIFDWLGGRRVLLFSMIVFGLATVLLSLTFHFLFFVFLFGVVSGVATSGASLSNTMALVSRWFRRRRGTVTGINATGLAAGGFLDRPLRRLHVAGDGLADHLGGPGLVGPGLGCAPVIPVPPRRPIQDGSPTRWGSQPSR